MEIVEKKVYDISETVDGMTISFTGISGEDEGAARKNLADKLHKLIDKLEAPKQ